MMVGSHDDTAGPGCGPVSPDPGVVVAAIKALTEKGNEIDLAVLRGLVKAMSS